MRRLSWVLFLLGCVLLSGHVWANGMRAHVVITEMALEKLPDGALKKLLTSHKQIVLSGAYFPDSGYAAKDGYGEIAHWEPYIGAFVQFIRDTFQAPFDSGDAAKYVAFIMGAASHSMADQCFDTLFMAKSRELDGDVEELDLAGDVFLVIWKKSNDPPEYWVPWKDAAQVFSKVGHKVTEDTLKTGMSRARIAQVTLGLLASNDYERLKKKMPWAEKMLLNDKEPGALPYLAQVVANYWQVLWRRLQGENAMAQALLASQPAPNATDIAVDHSSVTSQITFFFGYPLLKSTYTDANLLFENVTSGKPVPIKISWWGAENGANTLKLRPKADLDFDTEYKVTLKVGLKNTANQPLPASYSYTFRTRSRSGPEKPEGSGQEAGQERSDTDQKEPATTNEKVNEKANEKVTEKSGTHTDGGDGKEEKPEMTPSQGCRCDSDTSSWWSLWFLFVLWGWLALLRRARSC